MIEARARFDGPDINLYVQFGSDDRRLYFNLDDELWWAVETGVDGWHVITEPPDLFRRTAGMKSLGVPITGGPIGILDSLLNVRNDNDFILVV